MRIVLDKLQGEMSISRLSCREGLSESVYYKWSKDFLVANKQRLIGDTVRAANNNEVKEL